MSEPAVKLIRPEFLASPHTDPDLVLRRFEREALATAVSLDRLTPCSSMTSARRKTALLASIAGWAVLTGLACAWVGLTARSASRDGWNWMTV